MSKPRFLTAPILILAATAMAVFSSYSSATVITSPAGTAYTGKIHAESEGHAVFHNSGGFTVECSSTIEWSTVSHPIAGTATGPLSSLTFSGCTSGWTVTTLQLGSIEVHSIGGSGGTVTSTGAQITMSGFGLHCVYTTNANDLGQLTGGSPAKLDVNAVVPRTGGSSGPLCGTSTNWTGLYRITTPGELRVD